MGGLIPKKELDRERAPSRDHQRIPKDFEIPSVVKSENAGQIGKGSPAGIEGPSPEASRGLGPLSGTEDTARKESQHVDDVAQRPSHHLYRSR